MEVIICFCVGIIVGIILHIVFSRIKPVGTIRVDHSDPDSGPYLFLEVNHGGMETIRKKRYVLFEVNLKSYIPHK